LNVAGITQRVVETAVVWKTKSIDKCVIREEKRGDETVRILQTQKINIEVNSTFYSTILHTFFRSIGKDNGFTSVGQ
jgi:hypothetical protein